MECIINPECDYVNNFNENYEYVLFAVTDNVNNMVHLLQNKIKIKYIVDNDIAKQGKKICNIEIKGPEILNVEDKKNIRIVITSEFRPTVNEIEKQIEKMGYVKDISYTKYKKFVLYYEWFYKNKINMPYIEVMLTSKCSLNCQNCGLYMPFYKKRDDRTVEEILYDIDLYFSVVDSVTTFHLLGGEPLLHPEVVKIVDYISKKYRDRIDNLTIITNGTIIPSKELIEVCKEFNVGFSISNYTKTLKDNYSRKITELINILKKNKIKYTAEVLKKWIYLGSPIESRKMSEVQLKNKFIDCQMKCRGLYKGKIYYCGCLSSAVYGELFNCSNEDFLDIEQLKNMNRINRINRIMNFELGNIPLGYITFCQYCNGFGSFNTKYVNPAEQIVRK